jgi:hypothetical protein
MRKGVFKVLLAVYVIAADEHAAFVRRMTWAKAAG